MAAKGRAIMAWIVLASSAMAVAAPQVQASYPGSNGKIAYIRNDAPSDPSTGKPCLDDNIWIMNANGGGQTNINNTQVPFAMGDPAWSPDGKKIAYTYATQAEVEDTGNEDTLIVAIYNASTGQHEGGVAALTLPDYPSLDAAAFCENPYGPTWSPNGKKLAIQNYYGLAVIDLANGNRVTHLDPPSTYLSEDIAWAPYGVHFAVGAGFKVGLMPTSGAAPEHVEYTGINGHEPDQFDDDDYVYQSRPDWSPDGRQLVVATGDTGSTRKFRIGILNSCGGGTLQAFDPDPRGVVVEDQFGYDANHFEYEPSWSPEGNRIVFSDVSYVPDEAEIGGQREEQDIWVMNADGSGVTNLTNTTGVAFGNAFESAPDWQPTNPKEAPDPPSCAPQGEGLQIELEAFNHDGESLEGTISIAQTFDVELTLTNAGESEISNFTFENGAPFVIDDRSEGGVDIVEGPTPAVDPDLTLGPGEELTYSYELEAVADGIAAGHTKATGTDANGATVEGVYSLVFDIANGAEVTKALGEWVKIEAMQQFLQKTYQDYFAGTVTRGQDLYNRLSAIFSPEERLQWFGSASEFPLSVMDRALGALRGMAPEMAAASIPENGVGNYSFEELEGEYNGALKEELGKGVSEYVEGYAHLAGSLKKGAQDTWSEVMLASYNLFGTQTPEEGQQFAAYMLAVADGKDTSVDNVVNTLGREVRNMRQNGTYLHEAIDKSVADIFLMSPDLQAQMATERQWRANQLAMAQDDPVGFQRAMAKRDAEIINLVMPLILDTLIGGGVSKLGGKLKGVVVKGDGAAVMRAGEAAGIVDDAGRVVKGSATDIERASSEAAHGVPVGDVAELERTGGMLDKADNGTVVQSKDLGKAYEVPNLGGVPETTLDAKAGILGQLEDAYFKKFGKHIKLAEVLKPSSPFRKANGVAKTELTPFKTGKPDMLNAGAPKDVLAEASVWRGPDPSLSKDFKNLGKPQQQAAMKEWELANERWDDFTNPVPGSKTDRMKQCIGKKTRVPLDEQPNAAGIQRFVTAEYEVVDVVEGQAEAKLFRVKYYEVEVFDTNANKVVNRKTVVDVPEAVPQTPDADAVAVGKVVGEDAAGNPIIEPLSRAEREFVMPRYIDKNIKARRKPPGSPGAINDLAEHGVTLVMDDASAKLAAKLLAKFGVPFLKADPGLSYLAKIAKSVSGPGASLAKVNKLFQELKGLVQSEGGFGQHAVVVTRDSRYLGEVNINNW